MDSDNCKVEIYKTEDGKTDVQVWFQEETVWLTQTQIVELFQSSKANISEHIKSIFDSGELLKEATVRNFRTVQNEGNRTVKRLRAHYNLDVIISVGYRVNTKQGVRFRQWATQHIKDYLVQGYVLNEKRLLQKEKQISQLKTGILILSRAIEEKASHSGFEWLSYYAKGLKLLDDFDHEELDHNGLSNIDVIYPQLSEYQDLIDQMKLEFRSSVFGVPKDQSFNSAIEQIAQGFGNEDVYPTLEEKAAMLLYLITKNHAFIDGNKRIAASCFLLFLERNKLLMNTGGERIINNEALAGLTLLVAASKPQEMETVKRLIISVLNRNQ